MSFEIGDKVKIKTLLEDSEEEKGIVVESFYKDTGGWDGTYYKIYSPIKKRIICTIHEDNLELDE